VRLVSQKSRLRGSSPEEILYVYRTRDRKIVPREPDGLSMLREEGHNVVPLQTSYAEIIERAGEINIHPRFESWVIVHLGDA
jgi:hypothetical protein